MQEKYVKTNNIISFPDGKNYLQKREKHGRIARTLQKIRKLCKRFKYILKMCVVILLVYGIFTSIYYVNYQRCPEDWIMTESRSNEKKCKEFRNIYKQEIDTQEIRLMSNKCILAILQEKVDYSEILHYYIGEDGNASLEATAKVKVNNDFLNSSLNEVEESTYRRVQVYPGYQDIIQDTDIFYRIENGTISENWFEFYKTILETNYDEYYIDNYFEGFYTNPPDCHGVNITFYKNSKCEKVTLLISKNVEREDEFHSYIESVAKKNWKTDDNKGPLEYLLKYSMNYPNISYMIPVKMNEPIIDIFDILLFSFRNCFYFDNEEPIVCTNYLVTRMQMLQVIIFYFGIISCLIIPFFSSKLEKKKTP